MLPRIIAFLVGISLLVSGLLFAPNLNLQITSGSAEESFSVKPVDQALVCPGPLIRSGGSDGTKIGVFKQTGQAELRASVFADGALEVSELNSKNRDEIDLGSKRQNLEQLISQPIELRVSSADSKQGSMALSAIQQQLVSLDGFGGFAAANCQLPNNDFWIIGGSTETSREALLLLANPSPIDATVDLRVFTDLGEATVSGLSGISVLAKSSVVLPLSSFVPGSGKLAIHIQSQGAKLVGWLQQKSVRGTIEQGVDLIGSNPGASNNLVIPGFIVRGAKEIAELASIEENSDAGSFLRVFAPEGAQVTVQVVPADSEGFGAVFVGEIASNTVEDFPISELEDGDYSVFISSDKPIFSALHAARATLENPTLDFAWINPAERLTSPRAIALPAITQSLLTLANPDSQPADVEIVELETGLSLTVTIPSTGTFTLEVSSLVSISTNDFIFAAVTLLRDGGISDLEILDPKNIGSEVRVIFR